MGKIFETIKKYNTFLIMTHENPDGDAIGSSMAIFYMLRDMGKDVDVLIPEFPETFLYLKNMDKVISKSDKDYDVAIILDCANQERIGQTNNEFDRCKKSVVIDHHISNSQYGDFNHIEGTVSSCSQVLYYLYKLWNVPMTNEIGEALMTGCLTDTSGFRNNDVDKKTFLMAADMLDLGINIYKVYYLALSMKSMTQYQLMKKTLDNLELFDDGKIAFSFITKDDLVEVDAKAGDHEGLVDIGRNIAGVEVSIFIREDNGYRISLRSNGKANVNNIAKVFGGGGHNMAAGAKSSNDFKETKNALINETIKELNS